MATRQPEILALSKTVSTLTNTFSILIGLATNRTGRRPRSTALLPGITGQRPGGFFATPLPYWGIDPHQVRQPVETGLIHKHQGSLVA
jgi:hypothetical protein